MSSLSSVTQTTLVKFYANVMDDVLSGVKEAFLDEGVDEQILQDLKQMWENKIISSKAIEPPEVRETESQVDLKTTDTNNKKSTNNTATKTNNNKANAAQLPNQTQSSKQKSVTVPTNSLGSALATTTTVASNSATKPSQLLTSNHHQLQKQNNNNSTIYNQIPLPPVQQPTVRQHVAPQPPSLSILQDRLVPVQLTLPPMNGSQDTRPRIYRIQVPASAISNGQFQRVLTSSIMSAAVALPENMASALLQQHIATTLMSNNGNISQTSVASTSIHGSNNNTQVNGNFGGIVRSDNSVTNGRQFQHMTGNIPQVDGIHDSCDEDDDDQTLKINLTANEVIKPKKKMTLRRRRKNSGGFCLTVEVIDKKLVQLDGIIDTDDDDGDEMDDFDDDDDDEDDDDEDDDDEVDEKEDEENDIIENGVEDEPLNSDDDISDGDNADLFETDNVVVCQFDKINRARNKWKFYFKDGIMNLTGKDYIFQKATGDAEW